MYTPDLSLSRLSTAPGQARSFVRGQLERLAVDEQVIASAMLMTSELVTNAVVHGLGPQVRLVLAVTDRVRIGVWDADGRTLRLPAFPPTTSTNGRGLRIVEGLASEWGCDADRHGKTVWFELPLKVRATS